jgi:hypothetical protein
LEGVFTGLEFNRKRFAFKKESVFSSISLMDACARNACPVGDVFEEASQGGSVEVAAAPHNPGISATLFGSPRLIEELVHEPFAFRPAPYSTRSSGWRSGS